MAGSVTVGVCIGTYGVQLDWIDYVRTAVASLEAQTRAPDCVSWVHEDDLQLARNTAAARIDHCDWFIFLDADDELDPRYIEAMLDASDGFDIIQPSTLGVYEDGTTDDEPVLIPEKDLNTSNYLVIGSMCRASMFFGVGGFDDYPCLEDWALWLKMRNSGARIGKAPEAIYRVHVRPDSRNTDEALHGRVYQQIRWRYQQ